MVREFINTFRGMKRSADQDDRARCDGRSTVCRWRHSRGGRQSELLAFLKKDQARQARRTRQDRPRPSGAQVRHRDDARAFKYHKAVGIRAAYPGCSRLPSPIAPPETGRVLVTGCNWTPSLGDTFDGLDARWRT